MVVPITAHAAFDKAADLLDLQLIHVPVDPVTQRVDVKKMKKMLNGSTCMLVGSAPQFPHGSIDDIEAIAALGLRYDIPVHVDACLGGFVVAFMKDAGYSIRPFDFSVPGVTRYNNLGIIKFQKKLYYLNLLHISSKNHYI